LNGFLIKIYKEATNAGSPSQNEAEDNPAKSVIPPSLLSIYLVEPRWASSTVLKFSGTLGKHNWFDRCSASIMAFSHFVVESSACKYMFADIQGTMFMPAHCKVCCISHPYNCAGLMDCNTLKQNESALTLFNPMTHTPSRCVLSFIVIAICLEN
jgi:hypothetical protein